MSLFSTEIRPVKFIVAVVVALAVTGCATLPDNTQRVSSLRMTDTHETHWAKKFEAAKLANPGHSGFVPLGNGTSAFVARAALAKNAERSIDAQYYLWHDDLVGRLLLNVLLDAAERGVRVRLLLDDIDLRGRDHDWVLLSAHANVEVRVFNPFSRRINRATQYISRFGKVTRRMHNKSFVVDNQVAVVGGRNIGNEYFEADPQITFGDLDAMTIGPVVADVSDSFDAYWNNELAYPVSSLARRLPDAGEIARHREFLQEFADQNRDCAYARALVASQFAAELKGNALRFFWGDARLVVDLPEKLSARRDRKDLQLISQIGPQFADAQDEIIVISPYFIPGRTGTDGMIKLVDRGVRVRVLTNSLASNNHAIVHAKYAKYRRPLLAGGVEIHEARNREPDELRKQDKAPFGTTKSTVLHAKSFVIDRKYVFIGSLNFDPRSFTENTEIGIVFDSKAFAGIMARWFDEEIDSAAYALALESNTNGRDRLVWNDGGSAVLRTEPDTSWCTRTLTHMMRWLPGESQL